MTIHSNQAWHGRIGRVLSMASLVAALASCSTDKVEIPPLSGPSELGLSLRMDASPDVLTADGASTSAVQATVRDQNGKAKAGQAIFFALADLSGNFAEIGRLNRTTAVTGADGTATVVYTAPVRTDFTANGGVTIAARPVGTDANGEIYRVITIELRTAEGRLFPEDPTNTPPSCAITVEAPFGFLVDRDILFQTQASDKGGFIVRYFWTFGDSTQPSDKPDVNHHYLVDGNFLVSQTVTDNNGAQFTCTKEIKICPDSTAACPQP